LVPGVSELCPNDLNLTSNSAWDAATGSTPWYQNCVPYSLTYNGNGNTGGSVPDSSITHTTEIVTVLGNIEALYKTDSSFAGWNTAANGSGTAYAGGDTFEVGTADVTLHAQWTTASGLPVRIFETSTGYADIQSAYDAAVDGQTIEAQDGLGGGVLLFNNPHNYNPFYLKLIGGYNATVPSFTTDTGATLVIGSIEIRSGSIEIDKIIIQ
jgi:hypothetical protein